MRTITAIATICAISLGVAGSAGTDAAAQSSFGDTQLSYSNGVVYDDDLVPGRPLNQNFLVGEDRQQAGTVPAARSQRSIPRNSRNLIGSDGRLRGTARSEGRRVRIQP